MTVPWSRTDRVESENFWRKGTKKEQDPKVPRDISSFDTLIETSVRGEAQTSLACLWGQLREKVAQGNARGAERLLGCSDPSSRLHHRYLLIWCLFVSRNKVFRDSVLAWGRARKAVLLVFWGTQVTRTLYSLLSRSSFNGDFLKDAFSQGNRTIKWGVSFTFHSFSLNKNHIFQCCNLQKFDTIFT